MRLTKILFGLSDLCAWMLMTVAVLAVVAVLFLGPGPDAQQAKPVSSFEAMALSLLWMLVAVGAYLLTRRRLAGLLLVILPAFLWLFRGEVLPALIYAAFALLVFATPLILVWREVRRGT
ncbi:hypothetical protein [Lysobacter sp. Root983]|uniref:hypothetical protein n=1 Tax=Lysobacter sp. Root983 TaxID=1736613 RepID=UPI00070E8C13|nr:hypothetical protein [Lysobacter sp. Root983]KRD78469.1 hypothetical protein ASE43_20240 [Lysobacter sp. Root983]